MAAAFICILWALEDDEYPGTKATVVMIVTLALIYFLGGRSSLNDLFSFIRDNPLLILMAFGGYIVAGTVWSIVKWYFYVLNARDKYREAVGEYKDDAAKYEQEMNKYLGILENGSLPEQTKVLNSFPADVRKDREKVVKILNDRIKDSQSKLADNIAYAKRVNMPVAKQNKSLILTWMFYWPFSGVWTLINDPVRRIFQRIYVKLEGVYQKITDSAFTD